MEESIKLLKKEPVTNRAWKFVFEKPEDFDFTPGQSTEITINKKGFENEWRPFSLTSTPENSNIEFIIKIYPEHNGMTKELEEIQEGDVLKMKGLFGNLTFKGEGVFFAAGSGITPFISILRDLKNENIGGNTLIYSNKKQEDIILEKELKELVSRTIFTLTEEEKENYEHGRVDENLIDKYIKDFNQKFYICGPPRFVRSVRKILESKGVKRDSIIYEGM